MNKRSLFGSALPTIIDFIKIFRLSFSYKIKFLRFLK